MPTLDSHNIDRDIPRNIHLTQKKNYLNDK